MNHIKLYRSPKFKINPIYYYYWCGGGNTTRRLLSLQHLVFSNIIMIFYNIKVLHTYITHTHIMCRERERVSILSLFFRLCCAGSRVCIYVAEVLHIIRRGGE